MSAPLALCSGPVALVPAGLRGYRTWRAAWNGSDVRLRSQIIDHDWALPAEQAVCHRPINPKFPGLNPKFPGPRVSDGTLQAHAAPLAACTCGLYGWYSPDDTRISPEVVFGAVEAAGHVLMGTHGFRAEKARILAVVLEFDDMTKTDLVSGVTARLAARGVDVLPDRDALLERFPPEDLSELVDHTCTPDCAGAPWAGVDVAQVQQALRRLNGLLNGTVAPNTSAAGALQFQRALLGALFTAPAGTPAPTPDRQAAVGPPPSSLRGVIVPRVVPVQRPRPSRRRRALAITGAVLGLLLVLQGAVLVAVERPYHRWSVPLLILQLTAAAGWTFMLRRAWRWGR